MPEACVSMATHLSVTMREAAAEESALCSRKSPWMLWLASVVASSLAGALGWVISPREKRRARI